MRMSAPPSNASSPSTRRDTTTSPTPARKPRTRSGDPTTRSSSSGSRSTSRRSAAPADRSSRRRRPSRSRGTADAVSVGTRHVQGDHEHHREARDADREDEERQGEDGTGAGQARMVPLAAEHVVDTPVSSPRGEVDGRGHDEAGDAAERPPGVAEHGGEEPERDKRTGGQRERRAPPREFGALGLEARIEQGAHRSTIASSTRN